MKKLIFTFPLFIFCSAFSFAQGNIEIGTNAQMILNGDIHLVCKEMKVVNNGTLVPGSASNVAVISASFPANVSIGGASPINFHKLEIQTTQPVVLDQNITVNNTLTFSSGQLDLNGNLLSFGTNGSIVSEAMGQSIIGSIGGTANAAGDLDAPSAVNPGNLGMTISSDANLGNTTIARGHLTPTGPNSGYGIDRYYDISATNNTGLNATIRFAYLDSELNGLEESELELYRSTDGGTTWSREGFDSRNTTDNWVEKSGVDGFSIWTLGSPSQAPLPIELSFFKAECQGNTALLSWATASETNNEKFELEASRDGKDWNLVGTLQGFGTSTETNFYNYRMEEPSDYKVYRLKQIDFDGKSSFSEITFADCADLTSALVRIFPNPTVDNFSVEIKASKDKVLDLKLVNGLGQIIEERTVQVSADRITETFSLEHLPSGLYELFIAGKHGTKTHKILKETE
ncbi:MAG: T9SS type A sorting domain-containing protein [Saprospiraceae bacterium]